MAKTIGEWGRDPGAFLDWYDHALASIVVLNAITRTNALDHLNGAPRTGAELSADAGLDPAQFERILGFLAAQGVLEIDEAGRYAHTPFSKMLRTDHPQSLQSMLYVGVNIMTTGAVLPEALKQSEIPQHVAHGRSYFDMIGSKPDMAEAFARFMTALTIRAEQFIFSAHEFPPFETVVDVGGNHGSLLLRLLARHPEARGILFDLADVVAQAAPIIAQDPSCARVETIGGSFFETIPAGADLYLLKQVLHDWDDEECRTILRNIRAAMRPDSRLAIIDRLMPEQHEPHLAYQMDLYMLLLLGGKERRRSEFEALLADTGFRIDRVTEDPANPSVIEVVPV